MPVAQGTDVPGLQRVQLYWSVCYSGSYKAGLGRCRGLWGIGRGNALFLIRPGRGDAMHKELTLFERDLITTCLSLFVILMLSLLVR